jgi:uncharacterized protein
MIVDTHLHLGKMAEYYTPDAGTDGVLSLMDHLGIDVAVQMHIASIMECFEEAHTESVLAYETSGGRLPYALTYHPRYPADSLALLRRSLDEPGGIAIKIHPAQHQVLADDPSYEAAWALAAERGVPIIAHSWALSDYNPTQRFATPEHFERFAGAYPQVNLILGHAGGRYEGHLAAVDLARRCPNVYLDLSGDSYSFGFVEWLVREAGAERILFGSDVTMFDPRVHLGRVLDADIPTESKALILGGNACRLFRLG